jgi:hypothetical protein
MTEKRRIGRTIVALLRPVVGSMVLAVGGLVVCRGVAPVEVLRQSNDVVGNYLQTLGSIYAVLLAFVVFMVWTQFNEARANVEKEANELLDLHRTARGLPEPTRAQVQASALAYAEIVVGREWDAMACRGPVETGAGAGTLEAMWVSVHAAEPKLEPERSVYREVLKRLDDLSDARSNRITSTSTSIPTALRILLYTGAVSTVGSMYLFAVDSFAIHAVMTAALAGAISHVLYVIEDLDSCFEGHWQVPRTPFERVSRQMTAAAAVQAASRA